MQNNNRLAPQSPLNLLGLLALMEAKARKAPPPVEPGLLKLYAVAEKTTKEIVCFTSLIIDIMSIFSMSIWSLDIMLAVYYMHFNSIATYCVQWSPLEWLKLIQKH